MYAVLVSGGKQYKVSQGDTLTVDRLAVEVGSNVELSQVLMVGGETLKVGNPTVEGAKVTAEGVSHDLGDKRITFKWRRTRRFRRLVGFRASLTTLRITGISA